MANFLPELLNSDLRAIWHLIRDRSIQFKDMTMPALTQAESRTLLEWEGEQVNSERKGSWETVRKWDIAQILMGCYSVLGYSLYLKGLKGEEDGIGQPQTGTREITFCQGPLTSCQPVWDWEALLGPPYTIHLVENKQTSPSTQWKRIKRVQSEFLKDHSYMMLPFL